MPQQFTVKLDEQLAKALDQWMAVNDETDPSQVAIKALKHYLGTAQDMTPIEVQDANMADLEEHLPGLLTDHKEAMDLLK